MNRIERTYMIDIRIFVIHIYFIMMTMNVVS
jgi:hypothetical protein